jgi:hypothetical protein
MDTRSEAARAVTQSLRTGEAPAGAIAASHLADDVVHVQGSAETKGKAEVVKLITGIWPNTAVYTQGFWSPPVAENGSLVVNADFPPLGAAPKSAKVTLGFNSSDKINHIKMEITPQAPPTPTDKIPDVVRGMINNALANGTPMTVAYVNEENQPVLSLRGSMQVYGDLQICAWIRSTEGGLAKALEKNPAMCLLYRDQKTRSTLIIQGRGHFDPDPVVRQNVFDIVPEVERNHDPLMENGGALIIEVDRIQGGTVAGPVRVQRPS